MRYEIITDSSDLLVLVVNSRTVAISHSISKILDLIEEDYTNHKNKVKKSYDPALIHPELDNDMYKDTKDTVKEIILDKSVQLGPLLDL